MPVFFILDETTSDIKQIQADSVVNFLCLSTFDTTSGGLIYILTNGESVHTSMEAAREYALEIVRKRIKKLESERRALCRRREVLLDLMR